MRKAERGEERLKDIRGDACGATSAITAAALSSCIGPKLHVSRGVEREGTKKVVGVGVERKFPVGTSLPERELNGPGGGSYTFRVQKHIGVGLTTLLLGCVLPQFNRGVSYGVCTLTTLQTPFILYGTSSDTRLRGKPPPFIDYNHCLRSTACQRVVNHHPSDVACGRGCVCLRGSDLAPDFRVSCSPAFFVYLFLGRISPTEDSTAKFYVVPSVRHGNGVYSLSKSAPTNACR